MCPHGYARREARCRKPEGESSSPRACELYQQAAVRVVVSILPGGVVNAVKQSAVSTGQLSALLHLHTPPIDLVIFQEPSLQAAGGLILRRVSRLYAFSVYPGRT